MPMSQLISQKNVPGICCEIQGVSMIILRTSEEAKNSMMAVGAAPGSGPAPPVTPAGASPQMPQQAIPSAPTGQQAKVFANHPHNESSPEQQTASGNTTDLWSTATSIASTAAATAATAAAAAAAGCATAPTAGLAAGTTAATALRSHNHSCPCCGPTARDWIV